jgi:hypothetical protein
MVVLPKFTLDFGMSLQLTPCTDKVRMFRMNGLSLFDLHDDLKYYESRATLEFPFRLLEPCTLCLSLLMSTMLYPSNATYLPVLSCQPVLT